MLVLGLVNKMEAISAERGIAIAMPKSPETDRTISTPMNSMFIILIRGNSAPWATIKRMSVSDEPV
jgi:hypothetical protein